MQVAIDAARRFLTGVDRLGPTFWQTKWESEGCDLGDVLRDWLEAADIFQGQEPGHQQVMGDYTTFQKVVALILTEKNHRAEGGIRTQHGDLIRAEGYDWLVKIGEDIFRRLVIQAEQKTQEK